MDLSNRKDVPTLFEPGDVIAGSYKVLEHIRTSSNGQIYLCHHTEHGDEKIVMKVLDTHNIDETIVRRFRNEIAASYCVDHRNVVQTYEYVCREDLVAYTMEYVEGGDLAELLKAKSPLPIDEIIEFLLQMCSGVAAIHEAGIIHRDLKPENLLLDHNANIKISDFGVARNGSTFGKGGGIVGTIEYLSPEYIEDGELDQCSDIYSLGVIAYEMIAGKSPFAASTFIEMMQKKVATDPPLPHLLRTSCPKGLSSIVMKALSRDSETRYQSASEMISSLNEMQISLKLKRPGAQEETDDPFEDKSNGSEQWQKGLGFDTSLEIAISTVSPPIDTGKFPSITQENEKISHSKDSSNKSSFSVNTGIEPERAKQLYADVITSEEQIEQRTRELIGTVIKTIAVISTITFLVIFLGHSYASLVST